MNLRQAERNIKIVSIFSFISIPATYLSILLALIKIPLYLFMPWLFIAKLLLPGIVIVIILTAFVYFKRSRIAAIFLLAVYILSKIFFFKIMSLFPLPSMTLIFIIIWLCITLIWGLIFIQGIRATFVYQRLKRQQPLIPESDC